MFSVVVGLLTEKASEEIVTEFGQVSAEMKKIC